MTTQGFDHLYLETHNWGKSVAFWEALGFKLEFETDHHSGQLVALNGTRLFLAEQSPLDPVSSDVYLGVTQNGIRPPNTIDVVFDWTATHWGTQVMTVRDPDGRLFRLEAPAEVSER
jgi:catechol 2,3-dioxygenase-like lactoylglutathione lyase family enzyme